MSSDSMVFRLKDSIDDLSSANEGMSKYSYDQIQTSSGTGTGATFTNGQLRFKFEHSSNKWWFPSKSYIHMRLKITKEDGTTQLDLADKIAPSMDVCASLFQQAEFQIGGKTVSKIGEYLPQVDVLKKRMTKPKSWLDGIGKSSMFMQAKGEERKQEVVSDPQRLGNDFDVAPADAPAVIANFSGVGKTRGVSSFGLTWQPPLSIFDVDVLPGGKYELILTPESVANFKKFAVEQTGAAGAQKVPGLGNDYDVKVEKIFFYVCTADADRLDDKEYYIDLQACKLTLGSSTLSTGTVQQQFDVSPSTSALTVAFQDTRAGFDTRIPRTKLISIGNLSGAGGTNLDAVDTKDFARADLGITRLFVSYAGQNQPIPDADPEFTPGIDHLIRRYTESQLNTGMYWSEGSPESIEDFIDRGAYYHFNFPKDPTDKSTRVSVHTNLSAPSAGNLTNTNLLLFEHYKQVARIVLSQGRVVDVRLEDA